MRFLKVTAAIVSMFVLATAAAVVWKLGIFTPEHPGLNTPPTEQQVKLIPPVVDYYDYADNKADQSKEQNPTALQQEIETRYTAQLLSTAQDYEKQLNNLAITAWEEYTKAQKEGKKISVQTAFTYIKEGQKLETECDNEIYTTLKNFESELRANSLPLDKAKLARQEYEREKTERKEAILEVLSLR